MKNLIRYLIQWVFSTDIPNVFYFLAILVFFISLVCCNEKKLQCSEELTNENIRFSSAEDFSRQYSITLIARHVFHHSYNFSSTFSIKEKSCIRKIRINFQEEESKGSLYGNFLIGCKISKSLGYTTLCIISSSSLFANFLIHCIVMSLWKNFQSKFSRFAFLPF